MDLIKLKVSFAVLRSLFFSRCFLSRGLTYTILYIKRLLRLIHFIPFTSFSPKKRRSLLLLMNRKTILGNFVVLRLPSQ